MELTTLGGARLLAEHVRRKFCEPKPVLILGILADKDACAMAQTLAPLTNRIFLPPVKSERALPPQDLLVQCRRANPYAQIQVTSSLQEALLLSRSESTVVVTGSLYLIGETMELLGLSPSGATNEQGLNEYGAKIFTR